MWSVVVLLWCIQRTESSACWCYWMRHPLQFVVVVLALAKGIGCYPVRKIKILPLEISLVFWPSGSPPLRGMDGCGRPETFHSVLNHVHSYLRPSEMGCPRKPALRYHMIRHRRAMPWVSFTCCSVSRPSASCFCAIPKLFAAICVSHMQAIPLGECISHHGEKSGSFPYWSRYMRGFFPGAFEILEFKCTCQVPLPCPRRTWGQVEEGG